MASSAATVAELEAAEALVLLWNLHQVQLQQLQALFPENVEPWDLLMILMWMMEFDGYFFLQVSSTDILLRGGWILKMGLLMKLCGCLLRC